MGLLRPQSTPLRQHSARMRRVQNSCTRGRSAVSIEIGGILLWGVCDGEGARVEQRVLGRNVTGLVLRRGGCHWKMGKMGCEHCLEAIPFAVLRLKTGQKGVEIPLSPGFSSLERPQVTGSFDLNGESRCSENRSAARGNQCGDRIAGNEFASAPSLEEPHLSPASCDVVRHVQPGQQPVDGSEGDRVMGIPR